MHGVGLGLALSNGGKKDTMHFPFDAECALRENAQIQSKAKLPFKLVDEWKLIVYLVGPRPILEILSSHKRLPQTWEVPADVRALPDLRSLPAGAQVLSRAQKGGWLSPQLQQLVADHPDHTVLRVGIPLSYLEFIREAARVGHPCHKLSETRPLIEKICKELVSKPHGVKSHREEWLNKWEERAGALEEDESALKASMSKVRRGILAPKRLLLFKEILADLEYDDMEVVDEIICGGSLVGPVPVTDVLDAKLKPARISVEVLNELRDQCNRVVLSRAVSCGDAALDGELWSKTLEEFEKGHLLGPFEVDQLPAGAFVNNRFPIKQADKVRPIDNYSSSLVNDTVTVSEKPVVHSVDEIGAVATRFATLAKKRNLKKLFGKTADLKGAYRQLALADDSLKYSYLAVFSPEEKAKIFHQVAVPFGSTKAVYFFLRVARALWTVIVKGLKIASTNFFDDFVLLALEVDRKSAWTSFERLMALLGWKLSEDKATDWSTEFEALGVIFDLSDALSGAVKIGNTDRRKEEIIAKLHDVCDRGTLSQKEALQLRGRMQFAETQCFGRVGRALLKLVTTHAYSGTMFVSKRLRCALLDFAALLRDTRPRLIGPISCSSFMLLTDAFYDPGESPAAGLGGTLLTGHGAALVYFSVKVEAEDCAKLALNDEATVIYELELLAVLIGFLIFKEWIGSERPQRDGIMAGVGIVSYIDNDAARYALISGVSKKDVASMIVGDLASVESELGIAPWFARVGTESNLADEPSRFFTKNVEKLGFRNWSERAIQLSGQFFSKITAWTANDERWG